jgi:hydrogenase maturation protease
LSLCPFRKVVGIDSLEHLVEHLAEVMTPSSVIVCVGNDLCGDDGAGVEVARRLKDAVPWTVIDARTVPESFLMKIVGLRPETVLLVDALAFGAQPGAVELVEAKDVGGQGPSTHGPAPLAFLEILQMMHPCRAAVLGIQPAHDTVGAGLSEPVLAAVDRIVEAFRQLTTGH